MLKFFIVPILFLTTIFCYYLYSQNIPIKEIREYNNKVVVYSDAQCSYCVKASRFLTSKNIPFDVIDLSNDLDMRKALESKTGAYTVPYIFVNEEYIGGYNDMIKLFKSGKLEQMLD